MRSLKKPLPSGRGVVTIVTNFVHPPIPIRDFDWEAYVDGSIDVCQDPECGCRRKVKVGRGPTEAAAVQDLMEQYQQD